MADELTLQRLKQLRLYADAEREHGPGARMHVLDWAADWIEQRLGEEIEDEMTFNIHLQMTLNALRAEHNSGPPELKDRTEGWNSALDAVQAQIISKDSGPKPEELF